MSRVLEPMTYEDLSQLHREEHNGRGLTQCRPDLYKAMANLLTKMQQEYEREFSKDPDSLMFEGVNIRRKNAEKLAKQIIKTRTTKICMKALNSADGADVNLEMLTPEERDFYNEVLSLSKKQMSLTDHLRGKKTVNTRIDEPVATPVSVPVVEETTVEEPVVEESFDDIPEMEEPAMDESEPETVIEKPAEPQTDTIILRILEDLPPFVGPDRNYELHKEDIVTLPTPMAQVLINSQKAVAINPAL